MAFIVNAAGDKEAPIVIWKSENPRCFRGMVRSGLPVKYYSHKKAWMMGEILDSVLTIFNRKMSVQKRSVILFLDNAGCHPEDLKGKYSNVKIVFLPPNTTSRLQPLDLGIIENFKVHYRRVFLRYVLAKIDSCNSATEVAKSVNVLTAIYWIAHAWSEVKTDTIIKCFKTAGILTSELDVVSTCVNDDDPFTDIDELNQLIEKTVGTDSCPANDYISGDGDLPVCMEYDDATWEESFFQSLKDTDPEIPNDESDGEESEDIDMLPPPPKLQNLQQVIQTLEDAKHFLEHSKCFTEAQDTNTLINKVAHLYTSSLVKQTTIHDYFQ